jgi:DNA-binding winged helix-turn-helix (wHTH) protein
MSPGTPSPPLRFATFEVNTEIGELRRYGHRIKLQDKPFQVLMALVERPGGLVTRDELHQLLWPDNTFVDFDHNLNNAVDKLRKALNDSSEQPKFIETVPRRGYRFIAPVERYSAPSFSQVVEAGRPEKTVVVEGASPSMPMADVNPGPALIDSDLTVPKLMRSSRKLMIGSAVVASLLLALLFASVRFFALTKILASSVNGRGPEIKYLVIEKDGGLDPIEEGFKLKLFGQYESKIMRNSLNHGFDRWEIISDDQAYYYRSLTDAERNFASTHDWRLTCVCAVEEGQASANVDFGKGSRRFDIELLQEGDKYYVALTKLISPELEWEQKIEFPGAGDIDHLHTYELRYDHLTQTASLWIDGRLMASGYHGHTQFVGDRGLMFGSYSYLLAKTGIGVFRSVRFEVR